MKKTASLLFLIISMALSLCAQQSKYAEVIKGTIGIHGFSVVKSYDDSYLIAGGTDYSNNLLIIKIDSAGAILWNKQIGDSTYGMISDIIETRDSGMVLTGNFYNENNASTDVLCVKLDKNGDTAWLKQIDMGHNDYAWSIDQTADNGYVIAGNSLYGTGDGFSNAIVIKVDSNGNLIWGKTFSSSNYVIRANSVKQTADGGYLITGYAFDNQADAGGTMLLKLTADGNIMWNKVQNGNSSNYSYGRSIIASSNGYLFSSSDWTNNTIITKTDTSGNFLWSHKYHPGTGYDMYDFNRKIHKTYNNDYIFVSIGFFYIIDSLGEIKSSNSYAAVSLADVVQTKDSGYILIGFGPEQAVKVDTPEIVLVKSDYSGASSGCYFIVTSGYDDYVFNWNTIAFSTTAAGIIKPFHPVIITDSIWKKDGCVEISGGGIKENQFEDSRISINPNPSNGIIQIQYTEDPNTIKNIGIYNLLGTKIYEASSVSILQSTIDLSSLPNDIYCVRIETEKKVSTRQFIICH